MVLIIDNYCISKYSSIFCCSGVRGKEVPSSSPAFPPPVEAFEFQSPFVLSENSWIIAKEEQEEEKEEEEEEENGEEEEKEEEKEEEEEVEQEDKGKEEEGEYWIVNHDMSPAVFEIC